MIKTLQKLRLGSLKSDCQFHSYQRKRALHSSKKGGIYEPGVEFDWAMIIPSQMIIVRHSSDPVHDRISHFSLSLSFLFLCRYLAVCQLSYSTKTPARPSRRWYEPLAGTCIVEVRISYRPTICCRDSARPLCITSGTVTSLCWNKDEKGVRTKKSQLHRWG